MSNNRLNLGLCYSANRLYYALAGPYQSDSIRHVGSIDFNFSVATALKNGTTKNFDGLRDAIHRIIRKHDVGITRIITEPSQECWTLLPKSVYDEPDERESYLHIIMHGYPRGDLQPYWFELSNRDYKLLAVRTSSSMKGYDRLTEISSSAEYCSDFEIGSFWKSHKNTGNTFMTVSCQDGLLVLSSFLLGKLRSATYFHFDDIQDIPYLWHQCRQALPWMNGMHDEILVYGYQAHKIANLLQPLLEEGEIKVMDTLKAMQIEAEEQQYSFELVEAFPAIMLAVN